MKDLLLTDFCDDIKTAFGSFAILDTVEPEDMPSIASFAKIVSNYLKMERILTTTHPPTPQASR